MASKTNNLELEILQQLRRAIRGIALLSTETRRKTGLSASQLACLKDLHESGPSSFTDLSERLHLSPSSITKIVDRLEKENLVERTRDSKDRRVVKAGITEMAISVLDAAPQSPQDRILNGLIAREENEKMRLREALTDLANMIDAPEEPSSTVLDAEEMIVATSDLDHSKSKRKET